MTAEIAAKHAAEIAQMVSIAKVVGMWLGLALIIHSLNVRAYMVAWIASGHVTKWTVKWHDFIYEMVLWLGTLALWLDHYGKL